MQWLADGFILKREDRNQYVIFDTSCPCQAHTGRYISLLPRLVIWHFLYTLVLVRRFSQLADIQISNENISPKR
jgi:hypothetical protein